MSNTTSDLQPDLVLGGVLPNLAQRLAVLQQLVRSINSAEEIAPSAWSVTLFKDGFRMNVGQVEALVLAQSTVRLNVVGSIGLVPFTGPDFEEHPYRSLPKPVCALLGKAAVVLPRMLELQAAHREFIQLAGLTSKGKPRKGTPIARFHSQSLVNYARQQCSAA